MLRRLRTAFATYWARWLLALVLTGLATAQVMALLPNRLVERMDLFFYDLRMRVAQLFVTDAMIPPSRVSSACTVSSTSTS